MSKARHNNNHKSGSAVAPTVASSESPISQQISGLLAGLSENERLCHRAAFLHLMQSMVGTEIDLDMTDGKKVKGILHTATPFAKRSFGIAIKAARVTKVCSCVCKR